MESIERYMRIASREPIILEPEDWSEDEWKTILKIFGMKSAERIKVNCNFEAFGIKKYRYFELELSISCFEGEINHTSSMCVLAIREPTIEEAKEFWKDDIKPDETLVAIHELSEKEAHENFDMSKESEYPIFGFVEAVEVCPYCDNENTFPMWDVKEEGYIATCKECSKEIFLCDECMHSEDNPDMKCDWCKTEHGGKCFRGTIKQTEE